MFIAYLLFVLGFIFIIKGGDYFVDEATWIARLTGLPEVFIGTTIVSLGTTSPETTVSIISSLQNHPTIAVGNAIGSIICNTGLILGLYNIVKPSKIDSRIFKYKGILMLGYILFFWWSARKGFVGTYQAAGLMILLIVYIIFNITIVQYKKSRKSSKKSNRKYTPKEYVQHFLQFIFGLVLIIIGANLLVTYGVKIAHSWGVPEAIISLSIIALGTSLPELVTAISALIKGHAEISIGNIIGANILNICLVIGASASVRSLIVESRAILFDIPVAVALGALLVIPSLFSKRISRVQGIVLLGGYITYIVFLFFSQLY